MQGARRPHWRNKGERLPTKHRNHALTRVSIAAFGSRLTSSGSRTGCARDPEGEPVRLATRPGGICRPARLTHRARGPSRAGVLCFFVAGHRRSTVAAVGLTHFSVAPHYLSLVTHDARTLMIYNSRSTAPDATLNDPQGAQKKKRTAEVPPSAEDVRLMDQSPTTGEFSSAQAPPPQSSPRTTPLAST